MGILEGKRALIIGASGGIGLACAEEFLAEGAKAVGTYRQMNDCLKALAGERKEFSLLCLDTSADGAVEKAVGEAAKGLGGLDVLVNASGISRPALLHGTKAEDWDAVLGANLTAVLRAMQAAVLPMMRSGGGSVITIGSVYGVRGGRGEAAYSASKAGVEGLTRTAAVELAAKGIRFNVVAPGFIETKMTEKFSGKQKEKALASIPMKRFGAPSEVAQLAAFLASDKALYITGQTFHIDGGMTA